jgi:hypothetical protein
LPILAWQCSDNIGLWRSSQNKPGITQQRCQADENLLEMIRSFSKKLIIYDARPYLNALANRVKINLK